MSRLLTVDTSVIVAAYASWHASHKAARAIVDEGPTLVAHCALEAFSVLTRLPPPHRAPPELAAEFLAARFPAAPRVLPGSIVRELISSAPAHGLAGGAIHDALIAATALHHKLTIASLDARAASTYRLLGASVELLA